MNINWTYVRAHKGEQRWTWEMADQVGRLEWLLQAGMHYEEVEQLRRLGTKARMVSDYLTEVEKRTNGLVSTSNEAADRTGAERSTD